MNQDKINDLVKQIDFAWHDAKEYLGEIAAYPASVVEANDWLATVLLRVAELNAELANEITTSLR